MENRLWPSHVIEHLMQEKIHADPITQRSRRTRQRAQTAKAQPFPIESALIVDFMQGAKCSKLRENRTDPFVNFQPVEPS